MRYLMIAVLVRAGCGEEVEAEAPGGSGGAGGGGGAGGQGAAGDVVWGAGWGEPCSLASDCAANFKCFQAYDGGECAPPCSDMSGCVDAVPCVDGTDCSDVSVCGVETVCQEERPGVTRCVTGTVCHNETKCANGTACSEAVECPAAVQCPDGAICSSSGEDRGGSSDFPCLLTCDTNGSFGPVLGLHPCPNNPPGSDRCMFSSSNAPSYCG